MSKYKLIHDDCVSAMKSLNSESYDAIVTDPPYELGFMNHDWDKSGVASNKKIWIEALRVLKPGSYLLAFSGTRTYHRIVSAIDDAGFEIRDQIMWIYGTGFPKSKTSLKSLHEPIVLARKPLVGSIDKNYARYGVGKLNINESNISNQDKARWPSNIIIDSDVAQDLDYSAPYYYCVKASKNDKDDGLTGALMKSKGGKGNGLGRVCESCGVSIMKSCTCPVRSFINPKVKNFHPTVKPLDLMRYLIKLVTPPHGNVLDPFMGSGSTGKACIYENMDFTGIEIDKDYVDIAESRIKHAVEMNIKLSRDEMLF